MRHHEMRTSKRAWSALADARPGPDAPARAPCTVDTGRARRYRGAS
jgi:hypothetical protein